MTQQAWGRMRRVAAGLAGVALMGSAAGAQDPAGPAAAMVEADQSAFLTAVEGLWVNEMQALTGRALGADATAASPRVAWRISISETPLGRIMTLEADADPAAPPPEIDAVVPIGGEEIDPAEALLEAAAPTPLERAAFAADDAGGAWTLRPDAGRGAVVARREGDPQSCFVEWRRGAGGFIGETATGCALGAPRGYWLAEDRLRVIAPGGAAIEFERARAFSCDVAILRGADDAEETAGLRDWWFQQGLRLHDQGGEIALVTDEEPQRAYFLRLRRLDWPFGAAQPTTTLAIHTAGDESPLSYVSADYDARHVGLNMGWMQATCTHAGPA